MRRKSNVSMINFVGTDIATEILASCPCRDYLGFFCTAGTIEIAIGDGTFDDVMIKMAAGDRWMPKVAFTQSIHIRGVGAKLVLLNTPSAIITENFVFEDEENITFEDGLNYEFN